MAVFEGSNQPDTKPITELMKPSKPDDAREYVNVLIKQEQLNIKIPCKHYLSYEYLKI